MAECERSRGTTGNGGGMVSVQYLNAWRSAAGGVLGKCRTLTISNRQRFKLSGAVALAGALWPART